MTDFILEMKDISKSYHGVKALDRVTLQVRKGEVHALMGENGAGKSTLMKVLTGLVKPDEGEIRFCGFPVRIDTPQAALQLGIAMIHQELNPVPEMTVAGNIFLGREPTYRITGFVNTKLMNLQAEELLQQYKLNVHPNTKVSRLSLAQKQMLELIKAASYQAKLLIMDEPTSALSAEEVGTLFETIERLRNDGIPIIYISHRLEEIFKMADRVTILRDGRYIDSLPIKDLNKDTLITKMVGRPLTAIFPKEEAVIGPPVLEVKNLTRHGFFEGIDFLVRRGEILGISGLMGAGRTEVMRAIFGLDGFDSGEILLDGKPIRIRNPSDAIRSGITMVTEDRKELGLILCRPIRENMTLPSMDLVGKGLFVRRGSESRLCEAMTSQIVIKMSDFQQPVQSLSGGNQQKVVLAKWLIRKPKVLILDEPTRGIDVGAKAEIYRLISSLAKEGMAIIMVSSELPEIIGMSDRILVMGDGKIKGEFTGSEATQEDILACAIGGAGVA
ncbi:D-ribose transporter ATP-binding protein [Cohnella kolymensis]|uniref:D-ribose transporter ATP-binding protein n=1 Tax=Cohnella kolymensis TaxID=1590652 RepID=A0ABR5A4L7_9BACL|nr:sugar ABC transporter ATP-binding protein [Cohnella kolymensis]KIL35485.1 D-ribose transporter ATP-binding protein [Cohnella kolymensis]